MINLNWLIDAYKATTNKENFFDIIYNQTYRNKKKHTNKLKVE